MRNKRPTIKGAKNGATLPKQRPITSHGKTAGVGIPKKQPPKPKK